jgi:ABC-type branched-subunit amino acid transport system permease subunit
MRLWLSLGLSLALCIGAYTAYGVASSDSPWSEVLFTLLMRFEPPWFDIGDSTARVVSALAFWTCLAGFLALVAFAFVSGQRHRRSHGDLPG